MGTDITAVIEVPNKYNTVEWRRLNGSYLERNYEAFGLLFGVRKNRDDHYFPIRGLADNLSFMTRDKLTLYSNRDEPDSPDESVFIKDSQGEVREIRAEDVADNRNKIVRKEYENPPVGHNHTWILADELEDFSFSEKTGRQIWENTRSEFIDKDEQEDEIYRDVLGNDWVYLFESCIRAKELFGDARIIIWFNS